MNEAELAALLDAHDALVSAAVGGELAFAEFLAAYADFPRSYALDGKGANPVDRDVLRLFRRRIAFHSRVAGVLSGLGAIDEINSPYGGASAFAPKIGLMRLLPLVARYPEFEAEPENIQSWMHAV